MPEALDQRQLLEQAAKNLLDPQGQAIAQAVQWWDLPSACSQTSEPWPVAVLGSGPPLLLLHGFDSSHQEFRRLSPLLAAHAELFIPDLYGFGFCPRPQGGDYSPAGVMRHLEAVLDALLERSGAARVGLIGASMGDRWPWNWHAGAPSTLSAFCYWPPLASPGNRCRCRRS